MTAPDLAAFLTARLDDDARLAQAYLAYRNRQETDRETWAYEQLLADIDAKRRIIDLHQPLIDGKCFVCCPISGQATKVLVDGKVHNARAESRAEEPWPCPTLRLLALPYASHPDYRQEWMVR